MSCCNLITNYKFVVYVAFSLAYFQRQKFSFLQAHTVGKTGAENRRCQKMESIYGASFWSVCRGHKQSRTLIVLLGTE